MKQIHKELPIPAGIYIYLIAQAVLLVLIKTAERKNLDYALTGKLMYCSILLNFITILILTIHRFRHGIPLSCVPLGLTFTLAADYFLVLTDRFWTVGVLLFCIVETIYAVHLELCYRKTAAYQKHRLHSISSAGIRGAFFLIFLSILYKVSYLELLSGLAVLNMAILAGNVLVAWFFFRQHPSGTALLLALGLLLFAGCDLSLGLRNYSADIGTMPILQTVSAFLVWIFYLPSQVMIVMSEVLRIKPKKKDCS